MLSDEWLAEHFDHLAPELAPVFDETLERMRSHCPVAQSDQHGGFWIVSAYDEVVTVLQDWQDLSSAQGVSIPMRVSQPPLLPLEADPPVQREFKRLVNGFLRPAIVAGYDHGTRRVADELIDTFIEQGRCEFMADFANQYPQVTFFENVFHAPADEIEQLREWVNIIGAHQVDKNPAEANRKIIAWLDELVAQRRAHPRDGDLVDAVIHAEIDGRPITHDEIIGALELLMFGGFETTTSALGHIAVRLARSATLFDTLARHPERIIDAVEEFLRLDSPVVAMARSVVRDLEVGGKQFRQGEKVLFQIASANHDEQEFDEPGTFNLDRFSNRHLAFGAGLHRCAGSNLARLNLRIALEQMTTRLRGLRLQELATPLEYKVAFTRTPKSVPIAFCPGRRTIALTADGKD